LPTYKDDAVRLSLPLLASLLSTGIAFAQEPVPGMPPLDGGVGIDGALPTPVAPAPAPDPGTVDPTLTGDGMALDSGASQGTLPTERLPSQPELLPGQLDAQIQKCWSMPVMKGDPGEGGLARIRVKLLPDGSLESPPMIMDKPAGPKGLVFAESAARAIQKCAPYKLPPEQYSAWKDLTLYFDTLDF
jgi:hypothetical protein